MRKIYLLVTLLVLSVSFINAQVVIKDANVDVRKVGAFTGIQLSSAFDVYLSQGEPSVAVSAGDAKFLPNIKTSVDGGVLFVSYKAEGNYTSPKRLKAYISVKNLASLKVSGACDVNFVDPINATHLRLDISGASDIKGTLNAQKITMTISGASDLTLQGNVQELTAKVSGASNVKAYDMQVAVGDVVISGASDVRLNIGKELKAKVSGASSFYYKGKPSQKDVETSGAAKTRNVD